MTWNVQDCVRICRVINENDPSQKKNKQNKKQAAYLVYFEFYIYSMINCGLLGTDVASKLSVCRLSKCDYCGSTRATHIVKLLCIACSLLKDNKRKREVGKTAL